MNYAINLSSNDAETSFINEEEESENNSTEGTNDSDKSGEENNLSEPPSKEKVIVASHKKSKVIRSNKRTLSEIAQSSKIYSEAQSKRHQKSAKIDFFNLSEKRQKKIVYMG